MVWSAGARVSSIRLVSFPHFPGCEDVYSQTLHLCSTRLTDKSLCITVSRALTRKPGHYLYGLHDGKDTKHRYDIALGWTPDFNDPTAISTINAALDKPMSIIGDTVGTRLVSRAPASLMMVSMLLPRSTSVLEPMSWTCPSLR